MSLFDSASLVVTPNGYKEDKLYSIKPTDGSGDLVVTRATTATRVNSDGLIEQVPYNFAQYSEQFDNVSWAKSDVTISANAIIAPNGSTTADKIIANTNNAPHAIYQAIPTGTYSFSIYAKAGEETLFSMWLNDFSKRARFDLSTGTITDSNVTNATITPVGNGWYRCTVYDTTLTSYIAIYGRTGSSYIGNGVDGFYLWGAQFTQGSSAKEYFPTTDRLDVPRLDYTNSSCPSILVEPQRTNLYFPSIPNSSGGGTYTLNDAISPDGTQNASSFVPSGNGVVYANAIITTVQTYTFSVYLKGTVNGQKVGLGDNNFILNTFTITTSWQRYTFTFTGSVQTTAFYLLSGNYFSPAENNKFYIWGAQLEAGSYATSYIPTIASSVTRNADVISKTGISSLIGQTEGTIFLDLQYSNISELDMFLSIRPNSSNKIEIFRDGGVIYAEVAATNSVSISSSKPIGSYKIAFAYKSGSTALYINGTLISQSTTTFNFTNTLSDLYLNSRAGTSFIESANFKTAAIFKTRLTNDELASLTTI
jgi:hypothetical protein